MIEITDTDVDGELYARPVQWDRGEDSEAEPPRIVMAPTRREGPALGPGNRVLAKLRKISDGLYEAQVMRRIADQPDEILGVFNLVAGQGRIVPTDRRIKRELRGGWRRFTGRRPRRSSARRDRAGHAPGSGQGSDQGTPWLVR